MCVERDRARERHTERDRERDTDRGMERQRQGHRETYVHRCSKREKLKQRQADTNQVYPAPSSGSFQNDHRSTHRSKMQCPGPEQVYWNTRPAKCNSGGRCKLTFLGSLFLIRHNSAHTNNSISRTICDIPLEDEQS